MSVGSDCNCSAEHVTEIEYYQRLLNVERRAGLLLGAVIGWGGGIVCAVWFIFGYFL